MNELQVIRFVGIINKIKFYIFHYNSVVKIDMDAKRIQFNFEVIVKLRKTLLFGVRNHSLERSSRSSRDYNNNFVIRVESGEQSRYSL